MREGTQFYRCTLCGEPVGIWTIKLGNGCAKCGCTRVRPSNLSYWEVLKQVIRRPSLLWRDET